MPPSSSAIVFNSANSGSLQEVTIKGIHDDAGRLGYQSYPFKLRRPDAMRGPLMITGGIDESIDIDAGPAVMLQGEYDSDSFALLEYSCFYGNFFADETKQVDTIIIR